MDIKLLSEGTFTGSRRTNQDRYLVELAETYVLAAVADGIGSLPGSGEFADHLLATLSSFIKKFGTAALTPELPERFRTFFLDTPCPPVCSAGGSTLAAIIIHGSTAHILYAGDSRIRLYRGGQLEYISPAQTVGVDAELPLSSPMHSVLTHYMVVPYNANLSCTVLDYEVVSVSQEDIILLSTDGIEPYIAEMEPLSSTSTGEVFKQIHEKYGSNAADNGTWVMMCVK